MDKQILLNTWKKNTIDEHGIARFDYRNRDSILQSLFELLVQYNIPMDEATFLKRDVEKFMVTEEGMKGKNKHKGWKENVQMDFDAALMDYYQSLGAIGKYGNYPYMPRNPLMTAWAKERFGVAWTEGLNLQVHTHGHRFNLEFQKDVMDAKWAITGEEVPEYAKDHIA